MKDGKAVDALVAFLKTLQQATGSEVQASRAGTDAQDLRLQGRLEEIEAKLDLLLADHPRDSSRPAPRMRNPRVRAEALARNTKRKVSFASPPPLAQVFERDAEAVRGGSRHHARAGGFSKT